MCRRPTDVVLGEAVQRTARDGPALVKHSEVSGLGMRDNSAVPDCVPIVFRLCPETWNNLMSCAGPMSKWDEFLDSVFFNFIILSLLCFSLGPSLLNSTRTPEPSEVKKERAEGNIASHSSNDRDSYLSCMPGAKAQKT